MATTTVENLGLPAPVAKMLADFVDAAQRAFGRDLDSVVLYGSAAEGKLRATSDVNVVLVLTAFEKDSADLLREPLRMAQAAVNLRAMFLVKSEIPAAAEAFAPKFADILRRHRVLYGSDPFAALQIPRASEILQLQQQLLNLVLRLRSSYVLESLREEQLTLLIADWAGPLRSCAAALLELEGQPAESDKQALERVAAELEKPASEIMLPLVSRARETRAVPAGQASTILFYLLELARWMHARAARLS
jgi:predicted nucleotidyltransferase